MGALALVMGVVAMFLVGFSVYATGYAYREAARAAVRPVFLVRRQLMWRLA
jgi:hypothetical protein